MSDNDYMTVAGIVQFPARNREAAGKPVRDVTIRAIGNNKKISITVWPSHVDVPIEKGDFIVADGQYSQVPGQTKEGEPTTYHNLSAYALLRFPGSQDAQAAAPKKQEPAPVADNTDDDFPF
jgi:hypothetical protein